MCTLDLQASTMVIYMYVCIHNLQAYMYMQLTGIHVCTMYGHTYVYRSVGNLQAYMYIPCMVIHMYMCV